MNTSRRLLKASMWAVLNAGLMLDGSAFASGQDPCLSCAASKASTAIPEASGVMIGGSITTLGASGVLIVESVAAAGEGSVVVLKGASQGVEASIRVSAEMGQQFSTAIGSSVRIVATSTGTLLVLAGKAIAFIPNEIGLALLHQSKLN